MDVVNGDSIFQSQFLNKKWGQTKINFDKMFLLGSVVIRSVALNLLCKVVAAIFF